MNTEQLASTSASIEETPITTFSIGERFVKTIESTENLYDLRTFTNTISTLLYQSHKEATEEVRRIFENTKLDSIEERNWGAILQLLTGEEHGKDEARVNWLDRVARHGRRK